jgi:hypothetical protein
MSVTVFRVIGEMMVNENTEVTDTAINALMNCSLGFILKTRAPRSSPLIIDYTVGRIHSIKPKFRPLMVSLRFALHVGKLYVSLS